MTTQPPRRTGVPCLRVCPPPGTWKRPGGSTTDVRGKGQRRSAGRQEPDNMCHRSRQGLPEHRGCARCNNIGRVTVTLTTSESAPGTVEADVLVIGVIQTPDGPGAAPGADGVDDALGGTLVSALTALGATGDLEELVKVPGGGK